MTVIEVGKRFGSVDNRRPRTMKITSISADGTMVSLANEKTGRTTTVKAARLSSHGGYKPLVDETPVSPVPAETDPHDQHILDTASGEGMIPREVEPV